MKEGMREGIKEGLREGTKEGMREETEFLICERHNKTEPLGDKFGKNVFMCVNRYCTNSFEFACVKCRAETHKDHVAKFLTVESLKTLLNLLAEEEPKQGTQEGYDYYKRLKLIREFRRRMQTIEAELALSIDDVISSCIEADNEYTHYKQQLETSLKSLNNFSSIPHLQQAAANFKLLGSFIDYNYKKNVLEIQSPKLKELQDKIRKGLDKSSKEMEEMKEHTMKIIEVILHQPESDDEIDINLIRKKFKMYMDQEADNAGLNGEYKDIIDDLVQDLNRKTLELDNWMEKAELINPGIRQQYKDSIYVRVYEIAEENQEIHRENQSMAKELQDMRVELDDLRGKVNRMNERINQVKKALLEEDEKLRVLKVEHERVTGKEYPIAQCSINLEFWRAESLKLLGVPRDRGDNPKGKAEKVDARRDTKTMDTVVTVATLKLGQETASTLSLLPPVGDDKKQEVMSNMLQIIGKHERANEQWSQICQRKNQTIQTLTTKLTSLINYSRKVIVSH